MPFYNHERAIAGTLAALRPYGLRCWLVDDGSDARCRPILDEVASAEAGWVTLLRHEPNRGKGYAVMVGLRAAQRANCTHAIQIDADGQHEAGDIPRLLEQARQHPEALVTGIPIFDSSVPKGRLYGRYLTHVWVWINTLSLEIRDSMCGFRVYPLESTLRVWDQGTTGARMQFDTEIMVRMFWSGVRIVNVPTRVRYPLDGVSHFDLWRDNLRISAMHTRLFFGMLRHLPRLLMRRLQARRGDAQAR